MWVDSHVNLHADAFDEDREAVLDRARAAGVSRFIAICARWRDLDVVRALSEAHDDVWGTAGAHPHHAKDEPQVTAEAIIARADHPRCVAIGETGLDNHYGYSPIEDQERSFRAHAAAARALQRPLIIHCREADDAMAAILEEETAKGAFPFLLHCYTGGVELARRGAALGGYFSVNGIMTFKNAQAVRDVIVAEMPDDRIILETDAPYLAPVPYRGRRNEPAYLPHVADALAALKGWTRAETAARTTAAFDRLFARARSDAVADAKEASCG